MSNANYISVTMVIFLLIALLHITRIASGWDASIGGWMVPEWASYAAIIIAGFLAYSGFTLNKKN